MSLDWLVPIENGVIALVVAVAAPIIIAKQARGQKTLEIVHDTVNSNLATEVALNVDKERQIGDLKALLAAASVREATLTASIVASQEPSKH